MVIGRRTFVLGTALIGSVSALANLLLSTCAQSGGISFEPTASAGAAGTGAPVFRIHGWDNDPGADEPWININQSWRTVWR